MNSWIEIKQDDFEKKKAPVKAEGVTVAVSLSPYDIPEAVRGTPAEDGWFKIEFKYLTTEPSVEDEINDLLHVVVGKNSGRILAIKINSDVLKAERVNLDLQVKLNDAFRDAMAHMKPHQVGGKSIPSRLVEGIKDVVEKNRVSLFEGAELGASS